MFDFLISCFLPYDTEILLRPKPPPTDSAAEGGYLLPHWVAMKEEKNGRQEETMLSHSASEAQVQK